MKPRLLVLAIGNPSRGDDALGPALLDALAAAGVGAAGDVELLTDFQLQVEHALDLDGRDAVLFADAAFAGAACGAELRPISADASAPLASHSLRPQAVLRVFHDIHGRPAPPAWLLAIEGRQFELGAALSAPARAHLAQAALQARQWLRLHNAAA